MLGVMLGRDLGKPGSRSIWVDGLDKDVGRLVLFLDIQTHRYNIHIH